MRGVHCLSLVFGEARLLMPGRPAAVHARAQADQRVTCRQQWCATRSLRLACVTID